MGSGRDLQPIDAAAAAKLHRFRSQWIERVARDLNRTDAEVRVGVVLAYHLHLLPGPNHGMAWPSVPRLAAASRCANSTTRRALKRLRENGYIKVAKAGGGRIVGDYHSTSYMLDLPHPALPLASASPLASEHPALSPASTKTKKSKLVEETDTPSGETDSAALFTPLVDDGLHEKRFHSFWETFPPQRRVAKKKVRAKYQAILLTKTATAEILLAHVLPGSWFFPRSALL